MRCAPHVAGVFLAVSLLGFADVGWAAAPARIDIVFLQLRPKLAVPSTLLDPPPAEPVWRGAELAAADNNTTGQFTGQTTVLSAPQVSDAAAVLAAFSQALQDGKRLFVADVPADVLLKLADAPGADRALILDASLADDRLRGADCRANTLHVLPSRAMLADALMEYLVSKDWRRILLLVGRDPGDGLYAAAIRQAAEKFQVAIEADRPWQFNPAAQQADTGHYQVNDEVQKATQGVSYDVLVVADEAGHFGDEVAYRTESARPVAGTQGLVASAWARAMDEYASTQLQMRFRRMAERPMTNLDYGGWLAVRAVGEAATRSGSADPGRIIAYLKGKEFALSGYKGPELSFRAWDGQLRQPVLLADDRSVVSVAPLPGFLHERNDLDSLGVDEAESGCKK
jgi:ABC transporter substrate binding protein (PQQ-dependent alcohol dehydrogenase system)